MKNLKNWDNNTWLASDEYIKKFCSFIESKKKLNKNSKILDIGCGRANIISKLEKKYRFKSKPTGIDIFRNKDIKKNVKFIKTDAKQFLKRKEKFDLIIIKQTIHLIKKKDQKIVINLCKKSLNKKGKLLIFSLNTKNNELPVFPMFKKKLEKSLQNDERILTAIKKILKNYKIHRFVFNVSIKKINYIRIIKMRYISCLIKMSSKEIKKGVREILVNYNDEIKFRDILICISFSK